MNLLYRALLEVSGGGAPGPWTTYVQFLYLKYPLRPGVQNCEEIFLKITS